jgi:aryl-alcohol dehydrogenase-like predicted oxidoreductase
MARETATGEIEMERAVLIGTSLEVSRVAIGTWAIGGWMWGGTDEAESIATIRAAVEHGINLIDTAPVCGFGRSEEIVGKAIAEGNLRSRALIATKVGLEWEGGRVFRNASRARILQEVEDSLRRLRTDHIDVYQVHWPDPLVTIEETAETMHTLFEQGKIRAIGVSNFSVGQMERFRRVAPLQCYSRPITCSSAASRPTFSPIAKRTRSRSSAMARSAAASCPDGCGRTANSRATIFAARIRNFSNRVSGSTSLPWHGSINSPSNASTSE